MNTNVIKEKRLYTITCNSKYNDGTEHSYLIRITSDYEFAKYLMQTIYNEAEKNVEPRYSTYSDPKWLDDSHRTIQVTNTCHCLGIRQIVTEVYTLNSECSSNIYSKNDWILS